MRDGHKRLRLRVDERRAVATDRLPKREGQAIGHEVGGEY
jgi:hypothetical protein